MADQPSAARRVIVFGDPSSEPVRTQWRLLSRDSAEAHERNVIIERGTPALHRHYRIANDQFGVLLIGKDGSEKFRSLTPVSPTQLWQLIDQMPMRQREMKKIPH